ncbi:MAG TPA: RNA 2',3'-cyclic phosphodiesterase [Usitatibacter sp.]|nr:RNA 2',3'-cyclic phosphodiesterase [Usitatibacter sp.]
MSVFFALWPSAAAAQALAETAALLAPALEGKPVPPDKIHLTVAFLGNLPESGLAQAIDAGDSVLADGFALALDHVGAFRGARVAWAGASAPPAALIELHRQVRAAAAGRGLPVEDRAFAPHMTLVRGIRRPLPRTSLPEAIGWDVEGFALLRSAPGTGVYSTVAAWDLR